MKKDNNTIFSITAHIDLLGFSNHLILSSYDLRTKIGEEAIERLRIIEDAIELFEKEMIECKDFYPETFRFLRFNDSLILGIDINHPIIPIVGKPNEGESFNFNDIQAFFGKDSEDFNITEKLQAHLNNEAFKVSQFIGIVSRVHNFINQKEFEIHMAGCRTVISSGLRYKFLNKKDGKEDFYSANFSLSNAYIVNDLGTKQGFSGNKCYIENNVARICAYNIYSKRLLGFTKFIRDDIEQDPFNGKSSTLLNSSTNHKIAKPINIELFNKKYEFRELNTNSASNLQFFPNILSLIDKVSDEKSSFAKTYIDCLKTDTPDLEKVNAKDSNSPFAYPVLFVFINLQDKITESFKYLE